MSEVAASSVVFAARKARSENSPALATDTPIPAAQEAVNNAVRHAAAKTITVRARQNGAAFVSNLPGDC